MATAVLDNLSVLWMEDLPDNDAEDSDEEDDDQTEDDRQ